jgi:acyl-CoA synthetase (NDP forming)
LNEFEAKDLFKKFGISTVLEAIVDAPLEDVTQLHHFGTETVVKILSNEIMHKTEVGGVSLKVPPQNIPEVMQTMQETVFEKTGIKIHQFVIQEQVVGGFEMMIGMLKDLDWDGYSCGVGGITAELIQDSSLRLLGDRPLTEAEVLEMLQELKIWPLLNGYRGKSKYDAKALIQTIVSFSELVLNFQERILECEINPVFVFEEGYGTKAADGIVILSQSF